MSVVNHSHRLSSRTGRIAISVTRPVTDNDSPSQANETEPNNSPSSGQWIKVNQQITGKLHKAGDTDYFRFQAKKGQELGLAITVDQTKAKQNSFVPFLSLVDARGNKLAQSTRGFLGYRFPQAGTYSLGVRDQSYRGSANMTYKLRVGPIPIITSVYPLGIPAGKVSTVRVDGVFLNKDRLRIDARKHRAGQRVPLTIRTPHGKARGTRQVIVSAGSEVYEEQNPPALLAPVTANGQISQPGESDLWKFKATKGKRMIIEVKADQLGSDLDSMIEILDENKELLARATLRSVAKTHVAFRDHDDRRGGIRIETWSELAINDYLYTGTQLLKIRDLPTHPDSDCQFFTLRGRRRGYLGTTPGHLSKGAPMYKVTVHPPGTEFPPNGFPMITLYYRNDDANGLGSDSRLFFDPPESGTFYVRIRDTQGRGGANFAYRLQLRWPQPDFTLSLNPTSPKVWRGSAIPITVNANRIDGYDGPIDIRLQGLPKGFTAPPTTILAGENSTAIALFASQNAKTPKKPSPLKVLGTAKIRGKTIRRKRTGARISVVKPRDILTWTNEKQITLKPGGKTKLTVRIKRLNNFKRRIPINVLGMPHGVKVLDIGLNGILITEKETRRTMVLYCEPWVQPMNHPIVVSARREGTNTQHAAKSVLLRISK